MTHHLLKKKILAAVEEAYAAAVAKDAQAKPSDVSKRLDAKLDALLRPVFT